VVSLRGFRTSNCCQITFYYSQFLQVLPDSKALVHLLEHAQVAGNAWLVTFDVESMYPLTMLVLCRLEPRRPMPQVAQTI
jgi:hypothetical protein